MGVVQFLNTVAYLKDKGIEEELSIKKLMGKKK